MSMTFIPVERIHPMCLARSRELGRISRPTIIDPRTTTAIDGRAGPMIDKIFKAYDVRATYPNPLNEEMAWARSAMREGQY